MHFTKTFAAAALACGLSGAALAGIAAADENPGAPRQDAPAITLTRIPGACAVAEHVSDLALCGYYLDQDISKAQDAIPAGMSWQGEKVDAALDAAWKNPACRAVTRLNLDWQDAMGATTMDAPATPDLKALLASQLYAESTCKAGYADAYAVAAEDPVGNNDPGLVAKIAEGAQKMHDAVAQMKAVAGMLHAAP